jgi:carboxylesterase type B
LTLIKIQDYGFLAPSVQQKLQSAFNSDINCGGTDSTCLNALSVDQILTAQDNIFYNAFTTIDPSTTQSEPIRVVHDGSFITSPLDSTAPFPRVSKPLLISNVLNEAGFAIYNSFTSPLPGNELDFIVNLTFGSPRTQEIMNSGRYSLPRGADAATFDARVQLQLLGTDYLWKCAGWTFARNWVQNGGRVFVGMYTVGATYPGNDGVPFCTDNGAVCHQDDIEIVVRVSSSFRHSNHAADEYFFEISLGRFPTRLLPSPS